MVWFLAAEVTFLNWCFDDNDDDLAWVLFKKMGVKSDLLASEDFSGTQSFFMVGPADILPKYILGAQRFA